jgi:hypothetical protein
VKVPDTSVAGVNASVSFEACEEVCLQNCSCMAYASVDVKQEDGCITWHGDSLVDNCRRTLMKSLSACLVVPNSGCRQAGW